MKINPDPKIGFRPFALPTWIGSLPLEDHQEAVSLMAAYTPDIPLWIQLPRFKAEGMMRQFLSGLPGLRCTDERVFIQTAGDGFAQEMLAFYEEYMGVLEGRVPLADSRFNLSIQDAPGFFVFLEYLDRLPAPPVAVKGQISGPFTLGTGLADQDGRAIFYHDQMKDALVAGIALKARWQVDQLKPYGAPVMIFFDEPGLAGFGSSAFISISLADVEACLAEVMEAVHAEGGLAGIHVCANSEWSVILDSPADIVSFDAYLFFDKFMLYPEQIKKFINRGGILAWGIVPTADTSSIDKESEDSLVELWETQVRRIEARGIERSKIIAQSLITPSCGTGSLPLDCARRVVQMTRGVSEKIRNKYL
jgi:hypothetical protein